VRNRVEADVEQEKRIASARAEIGKALTDAKTSSDLKRNATRAGLAVTTTPFFPPLSESLPGILAEAGDIRRDLLDLSPKSPVSSKVFTAGTRFLSVAFVAEQPADQKEWETGKDAFLQGLVERKRVGALEAFLTERMKQAKVQINPEALK
jgi:hypothetical protein